MYLGVLGMGALGAFDKGYTKPVESEKLIIEQEIMSSLDRPSSVCYQGILRNLFEKNKVIEDIGGTKDSIKLITKDTLQMCYNAFYHPSNMFLVMTGNFNPEEAMAIIFENQKNNIHNCSSFDGKRTAFCIGCRAGKCPCGTSGGTCRCYCLLFW